MSVRRRNRARGSSEGIQCSQCQTAHSLQRMIHHWYLWQNGSLGDHLKVVYGKDYATDGRLARRTAFIKESHSIMWNEVKADRSHYSPAEAYVLAAFRLKVKKKIRILRVPGLSY